MSLEGGHTSGFRPMRRGQETQPTKTTDQQTTSPSAFTRQTQKKTPKSSLFPEWDLLPPKSIIRRKGQL